jgi:hypothetical protein
MQADQTTSSTQFPQGKLEWESTAYAAAASSLLTELRHMLENGCDLVTALDTLDQAQAALNGQKNPSPPPAESELVKLNLLQLLNQALSNADALIKQSKTVVLCRQFSRRCVRVNKQELDALLHDVIVVALSCCADAAGTRILRFRINSDRRGFPNVIVEHSGEWTTPARFVTRKATGVEVQQDHARCTIRLTFLNRC